MKKNSQSFAIFCIIVGSIIATGITPALANTQLKEKVTKETNEKHYNQLSSLNISKDFKRYFLDEYGFTEQDLRTQESLQELNIQSTNLSSEITKQLVYEKVLNTMDYYQTVHGKYQRDEYSINNHYTVEYAVDKTDGLMATEQMLCNGNADISYFSGTNCSRFIVKDFQNLDITRDTDRIQLIHQTYFDPVESEKYDFVPMIKAQSRVQYGEDGIGRYFYRTAFPGVLYGRESIDPQEMGIGYLEDFNCWNIDSIQQIAERDCWKVTGTLSGDYAQKLKAYTYEMYVDCETGFVLEYSNYDKDGTLSDHLTTLEIEVDKPIADEVFDRIGKQYVTAYNQLYNLPTA